MTCYNHPGIGTVAICGNCGKECCALCVTRVGDRAVCRDCAEVVRSRQPPEPVETTPEPVETTPVAPKPPELPRPEEMKPEEPQPEAKAPVEGSNNLPAVSVQSRMPVPVKPATMVLTMQPSYPVVNDPGAGGPRVKESLLSAALSLILPGAGQAYNGQIAKGVILAILYLGSMATILIMMVLTTLLANAACVFCLPAFILPMIVMIYAIYDAYDTAEKINNGMPVNDWL